MIRNENGIEKKQSFVNIASSHLAVEFIGPAAGNDSASNTSLVFLHEGLGSIAQWRDFPERLCLKTGLPGMVYERGGYGKSDSPERPRTPYYLHEEALDVLPELLHELGIMRPVLIGHSDGGSIALIFASAFPDRVKAVVTEAAHVFVEDITLEGIRKAAAVYEGTNLREQLQKYHGEKTDAMFRAWSETWLSDEFRSWNLEEYLPGIKCPLLVIQGEDDEYGTPAQVAAIVSKVSGPAEPLIIPGCGHIPHHQAKEKVVEAMANFILSSGE
jgi:pimeloyl-ACP methyl ester carboxylesterase